MQLPFFLIVCAFCSLVGNNLIAQPKPLSQLIKPNGLSQTEFRTRYLLGEADPYIQYKALPFEIIVPESIAYREQLPYDKLLLSGLNSMLFEYKNYRGNLSSVAYIVFANGNFNVVNEKILKFINQKIFPDQNVLKQIYNWVKPYYKTVFSELTYTEQKLLRDKLRQAEAYVLYVLRDKDKMKFDSWVEQQHIEADEKLIGFLDRRIGKKQWKVADCLHWISQIKSDMPSLKDSQCKESHFQLLSELSENMIIACSGEGRYYILDSNLHTLVGPEAYIEKAQSNVIYTYPRLSIYRRVKHYISSKNELISPFNRAWKDWGYINDSLIQFSVDKKNGEEVYGLFNANIRSEVLSGYKLLFVEGENLFLAIDSAQNGWLYSGDGRLVFPGILAIDLELNIAIDPETYEENSYYQIIGYKVIENCRLIIYRDKSGKYGILSMRGEEVVPCVHSAISYSSETNQFFATYAEGEESRMLDIKCHAE